MPLYRAELIQQQITLRKPRLHDKSLVLYLPFDKDDGSYARDRSGYNNHGVIYGATRAAGKVGEALNFDGIDDRINLSSEIAFPREFTIIFWFNRVDSLSFHSFTGRWADTATPGSKIIFDGTASPYNNFFVRVVAGGASVGWDGGYTSGLNGRWNMVAFMRDSANRFYSSLNGGSYVYSGGALSGTLLITDIGRNRDGQYFKGLFDEIRFYNRVLSQAEIARLMNMRGI
jgi:hypothetical protein